MDRRLQAINSHQAQRILEFYGFTLSRTRGSHQQFVGIVNGVPRRVTVTANQRRFAMGTLQSMIRQSGLSEEQWLEALEKI